VDELIGQTLQQRYQIRSQLGKKAGRRTFLAIDTVTDTPVVIKLLIFDRDFNWQDLKLFEREAETLKSLNHSAIPRYLDYFEIELSKYSCFALVQTYIDARSLDSATSAGRRWNEDELKQLARSLLTILDYLHSQNPPIVHRDLKPSNILIANRSSHYIGDIYLVDFGSVQNLGRQDGGTMTIVGTYGYMPPEQFGGKAFPASDLYSLGATLIYLVTGKHPADLTGDDGKIHFQNDYLTRDFIDWLHHLTEPTLEKRPRSVVSAKTLLEQPTPGLTTTEYLNFVNANITPKPQFRNVIARTFAACLLTVPIMALVVPFLFAVLSAISMSSLSIIAIPVSLFLVFAALLYLME
jgi:serine/threonine protein kinase